jgi:hypothetical protein
MGSGPILKSPVAGAASMDLAIAESKLSFQLSGPMVRHPY